MISPARKVACPSPDRRVGGSNAIAPRSFSFAPRLEYREAGETADQSRTGRLAINPREIDLHIDELVLHGFAQGDRWNVGDALESDLQTLLVTQGFRKLDVGSQTNCRCSVSRRRAITIRTQTSGPSPEVNFAKPIVRRESRERPQPRFNTNNKPEETICQK